MIDLVDKQVTHKSFGKGSIVDYDDSYIKIRFKAGDKRFIFPDAFSQFLTLLDEKASDMINKKVEKREEEHEEERLQERRELRRKQRLLRKENPSRKQEVYSRSQSVFWGKPEEIDDIFNDWKVFVGTIKSGKNKGKPRRLARLNNSSVCLITKRNHEEGEENRRILGMFMADVGFEGEKMIDGYIPAHPEYRIQLTEEESEKMLFWNYYINNRNPERMVWNSGRHRYFDNIWMAQILHDIMILREGTEGEEDARSFFEQFCFTNNISTEELPEPKGPLNQ